MGGLGRFLKRLVRLFTAAVNTFQQYYCHLIVLTSVLSARLHTSDSLQATLPQAQLLHNCLTLSLLPFDWNFHYLFSTEFPIFYHSKHITANYGIKLQIWLQITHFILNKAYFS